MSMPLLVADVVEEPARPTLRLADDILVDDPAPAFAPATDLSAPGGPQVRVVEGRLIADDDAVLPDACAVCGDTVRPTAFPTPRGRVVFSVCREHRISSAARAAGGAAIVLIGLCLAAAGTGGRASSILAGLVFAGLGGLLVATAMPVWTWRDRHTGERRLFRVHPTVVAEIAARQPSR